MEGAGGKANLDQPNMMAVTSTVSRLSLGISLYRTFVEGEHLVADKEWNADECAWKAMNQMDWYLKRGENVSKKDPVRKAYYRTYRTDFGGSCSLDLMQYDELDPPTRKTADVKSLCTIDFTTGIPYEKLPDFTNPKGEVLKRLSFEIEMTPSGASLDFVVLINGKRQGAQNVAVNFQ